MLLLGKSEKLFFIRFCLFHLFRKFGSLQESHITSLGEIPISDLQAAREAHAHQRCGLILTWFLEIRKMTLFVPKNLDLFRKLPRSNVRSHFTTEEKC